MPSVSSAGVFIRSAMRNMGEKLNNAPKVPTCGHQFSACRAPMDPNYSPMGPTCGLQFSACLAPMVAIPSSVDATSPNVHIMPAHVPSLPVGRARQLKCHQSAVQGFSFYELYAVWVKKANNPSKGSNLWPQVLRLLGPNGPDCFSSACGVPYRTNNARSYAFNPPVQGTIPEMPLVSGGGIFIAQHGQKKATTQCQSVVHGISFYQLGSKW